MNVSTLLCCSSNKLPFSTLLVSPGIDECSTGSYVCDINANCTKLTTLISAPVGKDTLETGIHTKVFSLHLT